MTFRRVLLAALAVAPMLIVSTSSWSVNATLFFLGMMPAAIGLLDSPRLAAAGGVVTGLLMMVAVLMRDEVLAATAFMSLLAALVGWSSIRGWHAVGGYVGPQTSFALIGGPTVALTSGTVSAACSTAATLVMGAIVAVGGLWVAFVGWLARHDLPKSEPQAVPASAARSYALSLAVLVSIATLVALLWADSTNAWWLILTLFVVVQPFYAATLERSAHRVLGTVLGAVLAAAIAEWLESVPLIVSSLMLLMIIGAMWAKLREPYWVYAMFLTAAVILPTSNNSSKVLLADMQRVGFTIAAAVVAVVVLAIGHQVLIRHRTSLRAADNEAPDTRPSQ